MGGQAGVEEAPQGGARFFVEAAFARAPGTEEGRRPSLDGVEIGVQSPDPFITAAATAHIRASGGAARAVAPDTPLDCPIVLIDHAAAKDGVLAAPPPSGRGVILLRPQDRDLIQRYRDHGFAGYLIKPLRRASLAERVQAILKTAPSSGPARDDERVAAPRFAGLRVLLAEDNPVGALLAKTLLRREGCVVETAGTGEEAVQALKRARYDLVFMDMRMPGMDGPAAARAIRARGDDTPILALTANAFAEDRERCLAAGMNDFLTKPVEPDELKSLLLRQLTI